MKRTLRKELYRPRSRRINTNAELRKTTLLRNNLSRTFNRKLITTFNSFVKEETDALDNSQSFVIEKAQRNLNNKLTPLFESEYRKVFSIVYRNNEKKYKQDKKQDGTVFGRNVYLDPVIKKFLEDRSRIFSGITIQMSRKLRDIIAQEFESGQTLPQITSAIRKEFGFFSRRRANLIARTETHTALGFANHDYHKNFQADTGITMLKRWRATNDARTRSFHSEANGQTVPMDEKFTVGGAEMDYVGDPAGGAKNVINCRCVVIYVDEQDVVDGVPATEVEPDNPFGDTIPEELKYHQDNEWSQGETTIQRSIKNKEALTSVTEGGDFSFHQGNNINMRTNSKVTWRHEFGHAIDHEKKYADLIIANLEKLGFTGEELGKASFYINYNSGISSIASKRILKDRRSLAKKNKKANSKMKKNIDEFGRVSSEFQREFSIFADNGTADYINFDDLSEKIRDYLESTDSFANTKFLDEFFGTKDWVEALIDNSIYEIDGVYRGHDRLLLFLENIKYNKGTLTSDWKDGINFLTELRKVSDKLKLKNASEELLMFSDFIGSVSNNRFFDGHTDSYYKAFTSLGRGVTAGHTAEAFANYYALLGGKNAKFWRDILKEYVPETLEIFDQILDIIGN